MLLAPLAFSSCENRHPDMDIMLETDFSEIIAAINSTNKSLSDKLALIEASLQQGLADNLAAMDQIRQAVASLSGSIEEKLAAVEAAVKAQTTSLETKLATIGTSLSNGFLDDQTALGLVQLALDALKQQLGDVDSGLSKAIADLSADLGTLSTNVNVDMTAALSAMLTAIQGLPDYSSILTAIQTVLDNFLS